MLSRSALSNYGKASLAPPVGWNGTLNIKRDPPKSYTTKRKEYVSDTNSVTKILANSEDRFSEAINYISRGVNPMVSVSYGEAQTAGNTAARGQAYNPFSVAKDGQFRPPTKKLEDLLPLSRLPRKWTETNVNPEILDYSKKIVTEFGTQKHVKPEVLNTSINSNKQYSDAPMFSAPRVLNNFREDSLTAAWRALVYDPHEVIRERPTLDLAAPLRVPGTTSIYDPHEVIRERPIKLLDAPLEVSGRLNPGAINAKPSVPTILPSLKCNRPTAQTVTNTVKSDHVATGNRAFTHLPQKVKPRGIDSFALIPSTATERAIPKLRK